MTDNQDSLAAVLRATLRNPQAVPQAELARALSGSCTLPSERRRLPDRRPRSISELQAVRIAV